MQGSGGTWISISQTGNDSGIAGGRVSITRTTEEALKGTSPFGDRNTLVAPGVYESRSGGGVAGFTVDGSSTAAATTSGGSIWGSTGGGSISGTASGTVSGTTNASGVSGALRNGSVSGSIGAGGEPLPIIREEQRQLLITSMRAVLSERSHDLPKFPELLILKTERARVQVIL